LLYAGPVMVDCIRGSTTTVGKYISVYTSHPGQLSLAIPLWVGATSTSQTVVMLCGSGVKTGMVVEWLAGKTVIPLLLWAISECCTMSSSHGQYTNVRLLCSVVL